MKSRISNPEGVSGFGSSPRIGVIVNDVGTGQWGILNHSMGVAGGEGNVGPVNATLYDDGTFIVNTGAADDYGIVSPDGNLFVLADTKEGDGDSEMILSVGIRNSLTAPNVIGEFMINQVGLSNADLTQEYAARVSVAMGASDYTFSILAHSLGHTGSSPAPIQYTVNDDGTADIGSTVRAQATRDGSVLAISGTDNVTGNELVFGIGLQ